MDTNRIRPASDSPDFERARSRLLDIGARAVNEPPQQATTLLTTGLSCVIGITAQLLNAPADTYNSLFVAIPRDAAAESRNPTPLPVLPRPPTHDIVPVARVGRQDRVPEIHQTPFRATVRPAAFGPIPIQISGTPAEIYSISDGPPLMVLVTSVSDWDARLRSYRHWKGDARGPLVRALLRDTENGTVDCLLALPLLCPWAVVGLDRPRRLLGHVLTTSSAPSANPRSRYRLTTNLLTELDSVLAALAELVAIVAETEFGASETR